MDTKCDAKNPLNQAWSSRGALCREETKPNSHRAAGARARQLSLIGNEGMQDSIFMTATLGVGLWQSDINRCIEGLDEFS